MSENDLIEASPCKLRNGNWGCKTQQPVSVGDTVRIVTRADKRWRAEITQIVWTDDQVCICETVSENSKQSAPQTSESERGKSGTASPSAPANGNTAPAEVPSQPPPRDDAMSTDELDAMADHAADQQDEFDDVMNAMQEYERDERQ